MVEDLAGGLIRNGPIPEECSEDALHIAIATIMIVIEIPRLDLVYNLNHENR
ncbi:MAG: hypothetical protein HY999_05960 [Nitrospinae bacterium]|nr:hypothetical protein [Nitrospinota bacterium]